MPRSHAEGPPGQPLAEAEQDQVTRLCAESAALLMQHGTESAVVESMVRRLGAALGVARVEVGVFAGSVIVTTLEGERGNTTVRRCEDRGINMRVVTEVQQAVLAVEAGGLDAAAYRARLDGISARPYPRWLVSLAIGLSCASFARLAGADWIGCGVVVVASGAGMSLRQLIARLHFSPLVNFFATAFAATTIAGLSERFGLGATPRAVAASSVLMLVPGFPLINGVSDMVKGYWSTGLARLAYATLLSVAACAGTLLAIALWGLRGTT
ncbi:MAG: threonine/serine exporter family protein [Anaeromyxobacter sp.]